MQYVIRWLAALGVLAALLSFSAGAEEAAGEFNLDEYLIAEYGEAFWANYGQAQAYHGQLMSFFTKDSGGEIVYPDFVGGIYYNDEGNFVLQIVEGYASKDAGLYERVKGFTAQSNGMIIEQVAYSYNEIHALMDTLNAMYLADDSPEAFGNVVSFGEDTVGNRVVMNLAVCSEEEIARFRDTVSDSPMIGFEQSLGKLMDFRLDSSAEGEARGEVSDWIWPVVGVVLLALLGLAGILLWRAKRRRRNINAPLG